LLPENEQLLSVGRDIQSFLLKKLLVFAEQPDHF